MKNLLLGSFLAAVAGAIVGAILAKFMPRET